MIKNLELKLEEEMMPIRDAVIQKKQEIRQTDIEAELQASEARKRLEQQELANSVEVANKKLEISAGALTAINNLVQAFAQEDERSARRAFNINKAVGIAQATINTAQAITKTFAETTDPTPTQSFRFANAAIVAASGAAQIAAIAKTKFQPSGGGSSSSASSSIPTASAAAPTFDNIGDTGVNQLAQTLGQQGKQPVKAFVVSSDVTSAQSLDRKKIQNSTL